MRVERGISDWRAAAHPDDLREYDRFGPWIDQVEELVDMPRRFRPWWGDVAGARYLLKLPSDYDRSQVRPGMDLYHSVIAVFPEWLCLLRAAGTGVERTILDLDRIVATNRHTNLLVGRWSLLLADGDTVDIDFNTVSQHLISDVDSYILRSLPSAGAIPHRLPAVRPEDHLFRSVVAGLNAVSDQPVTPIHVEEAGRPCLDERRRRRRTSGVMVLASGDDLVVVNRGSAARSRFRMGNYAVNVLTVPFRAISSFGVTPPEPGRLPRFSRLVLSCEQQVITQPCLDLPEPVVATLRARGIPQDDRAGEVVGLR